MFDIGTTKVSPTFAAYLTTLEEMCGENLYAKIWLWQVVQVALIWDHHVDGDPIDPKMFDLAMTALVTEWPCNPFIRKNADFLIPTVVASIAAWKNSNGQRVLEYEPYRAIPAAVAFVLGGNDLVNTFMPKITELVLAMQKEDDLRDSTKERENE